MVRGSLRRATWRRSSSRRAPEGGTEAVQAARSGFRNACRVVTHYLAEMVVSPQCQHEGATGWIRGNNVVTCFS